FRLVSHLLPKLLDRLLPPGVGGDVFFGWRRGLERRERLHEFRILRGEQVLSTFVVVGVEMGPDALTGLARAPGRRRPQLLERAVDGDQRLVDGRVGRGEEEHSGARELDEVLGEQGAERGRLPGPGRSPEVSDVPARQLERLRLAPPQPREGAGGYDLLLVESVALESPSQPANALLSPRRVVPDVPQGFEVARRVEPNELPRLRRRRSGEAEVDLLALR